jgi:hypothetical protein
MAAAQSPQSQALQYSDHRQFNEITREEYDTFLTPREMLTRMPFGAANMTQIGRELRADRYRSAADEAQWAYGGFKGSDKLAVLPSWLWAIAMPPPESDFWHTGYLDAWIPDPEKGGYPVPGTGNWLRLYGVRFWAPFLDEQPSASANAPPADELQRNKGGRPRNDYWEALLVEIARQLYSGDLQPKRQADIEGAMQDWLTDKGHKWGETQVRQRAKSLWEAIEK